MEGAPEAARLRAKNLLASNVDSLLLSCEPDGMANTFSTYCVDIWLIKLRCPGLLPTDGRRFPRHPALNLLSWSPRSAARGWET